MPSCDLTIRSDELAARAVALRAERGYNCAQAVACALAPEIGADTEACYVLSEGFGGGMGGHTETCGAISGGVMALGQVSSGGTALSGTTKKRTYELTRLFQPNQQQSQSIMLLTYLLLKLRLENHF